MTLRQKIWTEAIHGWLHTNENRLDFKGCMTAEDFYDYNKKTIDKIFYELREKLQVQMTRGMNNVLLWGIESYLKAENMLYVPPPEKETEQLPPRFGKGKKR